MRGNKGMTPAGFSPHAPPPMSPSAAEIAFEIQQGIGSGNWGRAAIADRLETVRRDGAAVQLAQIVAMLRDMPTRDARKIAGEIGMPTSRVDDVLCALADLLERRR